MKRIICLTMALVMTFACVSAFAAQYDGLPEKMMLQMELSGLKGSVTLSATGNPELEALLFRRCGSLTEVQRLLEQLLP